MRKLIKGVLLAGVAFGTAVAVKSYLDRNEGKPSGEPVQITFADGSVKVLSSDDIEGREFSDIARKLVEAGL